MSAASVCNFNSAAVMMKRADDLLEELMYSGVSAFDFSTELGKRCDEILRDATDEDASFFLRGLLLDSYNRIHRPDPRDKLVCIYASRKHPRLFWRLSVCCHDEYGNCHPWMPSEEEKAPPDPTSLLDCMINATLTFPEVMHCFQRPLLSIFYAKLALGRLRSEALYHRGRRDRGNFERWVDLTNAGMCLERFIDVTKKKRDEGLATVLSEILGGAGFHIAIVVSEYDDENSVVGTFECCPVDEEDASSISHKRARLAPGSERRC